MARDNLRTYGEKLNAQELRKLLDFALAQNDVLAQKGKRGTPICVWGTHGLGKTESILGFAKENNWTTVYCAPAQFEEMGDLHGIPEVYDPTPDLPNSGDEYTVYRPPQWLKSAINGADLDKPGLLILDDFNRAESRILQGCMQLLQMHALFSWALPPRWQIVLTANPEGGPYNVTEMDDAMLTRMMHVTMRFDAESWALWATAAGIDPRGIDFVLTYPEVVTGIRTTARSLTQFFQQIESIKDLNSEENLYMINILGKATLENETVDKFLYFCKHVQSTLLQPEEILNTKDFQKNIVQRLKRIISGDGQGKRTDRLKTICTRLLIYVTDTHYKLEDNHKKNIIDFLLNDEMDAALRFNVHRHIANSKTKACRDLIRDRRLAKIILEGL
jgi:hypothetical protein